LLGAFVGSGIGGSLDRADEVYARQAAARAYAAPVGVPIQWSNPHTGNLGAVQTTRDGWTTSGAYCREFQQQVVVAGRVQSAFGQACQQPDGTWRIVG
jgi:surface antigen